MSNRHIEKILGYDNGYYLVEVYKRSNLEILTCYLRLDLAPPFVTQSRRPIVGQDSRNKSFKLKMNA